MRDEASYVKQLTAISEWDAFWTHVFDARAVGLSPHGLDTLDHAGCARCIDHSDSWISMLYDKPLRGALYFAKVLAYYGLA